MRLESGRVAGCGRLVFVNQKAGLVGAGGIRSAECIEYAHGVAGQHVMFDALLSDNTNSWELAGDGSWRRLRAKKDDRRVSAQGLLMRNAVARARRTVSRRT